MYNAGKIYRCNIIQIHSVYVHLATLCKAIPLSSPTEALPGPSLPPPLFLHLGNYRVAKD